MVFNQISLIKNVDYFVTFIWIQEILGIILATLENGPIRIHS